MNEEFEKILPDGLYAKAQVDQIRKAWEFTKQAHHGQNRLNGESYALHCLAISKTLISWKLDSTSIVAGLIHDVISEGAATKDDVLAEFGKEVADLIEGVSKVTNIRLRGSTDTLFVENLRKMLLVIARDLRVLLIKLADRLHNMETLSALSPDKQQENAFETLEIYAPLAERLGIGQVKGMLEDLAFPYAYPNEYASVVQASKPHYKNAEVDIRKMRRTLLSGLAKESIKSEVQARKKRIYSLWKKLERPGIEWDFEKINDIIAVRILVDSVSDCYASLGVVHHLYKPVPHIGISDFIAQPKPNGYQSLHTKVFGAEGRIVEVQIRTYKMHEQAEHGIAAHWAYSEFKEDNRSHDEIVQKGVSVQGDRLKWVQELVKWQDELKESKDFLQAVKFDALSHRNFIFSPKGDVYDLPAGATPVDFAYAVHSGLGKFIKGAKVNGRVVPLNFKLQSGDVVEVLKSKNPKPATKDWLKFVVTGQARKQILKEIKAIS